MVYKVEVTTIGKKEMGIIRKWVGWSALIAALCLGAYQGVGNGIEYSEGVRTGMVNKFSNKGLFWKTYEGQMALEGIVSGNQMMGANIWDFSLDRQEIHGEDTKKIIAQLKECMENGKKVKISYIQQLAVWPWRGDTKYLVQKVEPIGRMDYNEHPDENYNE